MIRCIIHHMVNSVNLQSSPNAITVRDLVVKRGKKLVYDGLNVDFPAGRITGLLGPSGGGKTTLMRAIVGVQIIESGSVTVSG